MNTAENEFLTWDCASSPYTAPPAPASPTPLWSPEPR